MTRLGVPSYGGTSLLSAFILLLSTGQVFSSGALDVLNAGMEYGWTSAAFPVLLGNETEPVITSEQGVWIAILALPGAVGGALANAFVCDVVGRKPFIMFTALPYVITWVLIAVSNAASYYYIARTISGFSSGMVLTAIPMYIGEISNPKLRGRLCAIVPMCIAAGVFLINFLSIFLTIEVSALVVLAFPLTSFLGLLFMPESPYFYLMKNKEEEALRSLKIFEGKEDVDSDFQRMKQAVQEHNDPNQGGIKALLTIKENRRSLYIVGFIKSAQPLCGITTLVYYSSIILGDNETHLSVKYSTLLFGIALMTSVIIGVNIIDSLGRRPLILFSIVGSFFGLLSLAVYLHLKVFDIDLTPYSSIPLVALVTTVFFYGIGLQHVPFVIQGELFSTAVKASAGGIGLILFNIFSFLCSKYFQYMNDNLKAYIPIYTFATCTAVTFVFILLFLPETKNVSLEDVQLMMKQGKLHFKDVDSSLQ